MVFSAAVGRGPARDNSVIFLTSMVINDHNGGVAVTEAGAWKPLTVCTTGDDGEPNKFRSYHSLHQPTQSQQC